MTAESILKRKYSPESKIPDPVDYLTHYKNSCCKSDQGRNPLPPIQITRAADAYRLIKHELAPADRETLRPSCWTQSFTFWESIPWLSAVSTPADRPFGKFSRAPSWPMLPASF